MAYTKAPYGTKKAAAVAARVTPEWIRNWRAALSDAELYCARQLRIHYGVTRAATAAAFFVPYGALV